MRLYRLSPPARSSHVFSTSQRGAAPPGPRLQLVPGWAVLAQVWEAAGPRERVVIRATALAAQSPSRVFCGLTGLLLSGLPTPTPPFITTVASSRSHLGKQRRPASVAASTHRRHHHPQPGPAGLKAHLETRPDGNDFRVAAHTLCAWEVLTAPDFPAALATADALAKHSDTLALETWPTLGALIDMTPYPVRKRRLERALDAARASSESVAESMSRALMLEWGFPEPVLQQDHFDERGFIGRSDFCWPELKLIGEFGSSQSRV